MSARDESFAPEGHKALISQERLMVSDGLIPVEYPGESVLALNVNMQLGGGLDMQDRAVVICEERRIAVLEKSVEFVDELVRRRSRIFDGVDPFDLTDRVIRRSARQRIGSDRAGKKAGL